MLKFLIFATCLSGIFAKECASPEIPCGNYDCYNPATQKCLQSEFGKKYGNKGDPCPLDGTDCAGNCLESYPGMVCLSENSGNGEVTVMCDAAEKQCGEWCYNPDDKVCSLGTVCEKSETSCGEICYTNDGTFDCVHSDHGFILCMPGEKSCGEYMACYDPATHTCDDATSDVTPIS